MGLDIFHPSWLRRQVGLIPLSEMSKVPTHETRGNSSWITPAPADLNCWRKTERKRDMTGIATSVKSMEEMSECGRRGTDRRSVPHSCWCPGVNRWYEGYWTDPGTEPWGGNRSRVGTGISGTAGDKCEIWPDKKRKRQLMANHKEKMSWGERKRLVPHKIQWLLFLPSNNPNRSSYLQPLHPPSCPASSLTHLKVLEPSYGI